MGGRYVRRLGPAGGLADFGVSHVRLEPGGISSQRHWHENEDEFVVILAGEAILVEEDGETPMRAGECAVFPKGVANGHQLVNRSARDCIFLAIGQSTNGPCHYSDVDLDWDGPGQRFTHRDGTPY
jgi:uncharacterized cupin superfamily protein